MRNSRFSLLTVGFAFALFIGMLLFLEFGRQLGVREFEKLGESSRSGVGVVDGTVYGLLGLLLGFTFSGAAARFDKRRELVVKEVNAVSTAWHRIDALPAAAQGQIRAGFRNYVDALIAAYKSPPGSPEELRDRAAATSTQKDVWTRSMSACLAPDGEKARMLLLPAMNEMFVAVETERHAQRLHPPLVVFVMLTVTALAAAVFGGYGLASGSTRNWMYMLGVAATISVATYVILELESPRYGLIRVDSIDQTLVELRATMNDPVEKAWKKTG